MKNIIVFFAICIFVSTTAYAANESGVLPKVPSKGMVTMLELGADKCIPCKMMAPIIADLKIEYKGKVSILFIDVWKNRDQPKKYKLTAIPTQIFYNKEGREVFRHVGFFDKKSIVGKFKELGVQ